MRILLALAMMLMLLSCVNDNMPPTWSEGDPAVVARKLKFFRHPQAPDLCIGYMWDGGGGSGGPALMEVDCAKVAHLLLAPPKPECQK
jgi:hypothetical protein